MCVWNWFNKWMKQNTLTTIPTNEFNNMFRRRAFDISWNNFPTLILWLEGSMETKFQLRISWLNFCSPSGTRKKFGIEEKNLFETMESRKDGTVSRKIGSVSTNDMLNLEAHVARKQGHTHWCDRCVRHSVHVRDVTLGIYWWIFCQIVFGFSLFCRNVVAWRAQIYPVAVRSDYSATARLVIPYARLVGPQRFINKHEFYEHLCCLDQSYRWCLCFTNILPRFTFISSLNNSKCTTISDDCRYNQQRIFLHMCQNDSIVFSK